MNRIGAGQQEYEFSIEFEAPGRDLRRFFGDTLTLEASGQLGELMNGEYTQCPHCDDLAEVDYLETHLEDTHNIIP